MYEDLRMSRNIMSIARFQTGSRIAENLPLFGVGGGGVVPNIVINLMNSNIELAPPQPPTPFILISVNLFQNHGHGSEFKLNRCYHVDKYL